MQVIYDQPQVISQPSAEPFHHPRPSTSQSMSRHVSQWVNTRLALRHVPAFLPSHGHINRIQCTKHDPASHGQQTSSTLIMGLRLMVSSLWLMRRRFPFAATEVSADLNYQSIFPTGVAVFRHSLTLKTRGLGVRERWTWRSRRKHSYAREIRGRTH
jgi:hypothetical protein